MSERVFDFSFSAAKEASHASVTRKKNESIVIEMTLPSWSWRFVETRSVWVLRLPRRCPSSPRGSYAIQHNEAMVERKPE